MKALNLMVTAQSATIQHVGNQSFLQAAARLVSVYSKCLVLDTSGKLTLHKHVTQKSLLLIYVWVQRNLVHLVSFSDFLCIVYLLS